MPSRLISSSDDEEPEDVELMSFFNVFLTVFLEGLTGFPSRKVSNALLPSLVFFFFLRERSFASSESESDELELSEESEALELLSLSVSETTVFDFL